MNKKKIAILGGGVGGLSAAQELAEQGSFEVHVYEAGPGVGGKARSQAKAGTGAGGRQDLPGEHGFRFFPAFYKHVIDTMARIPTEGGQSVADRLVGCEEMALAEPGRAPSVFPRHRPSSIGEFFDLVGAVAQFYCGADLADTDLGRFAEKMLQYLCSCDERRMRIYEEMSYWEFVEGDLYSERFQSYIESPRFMVAMDPKRGSARTIGNKALQILLDFWRPSGTNDRVLDGPTTARWIDPWEAHLRTLGVVFHLGRPLLRVDFDAAAKRITRAYVGGPAEEAVEADYYVLSVPMERVGGCLGGAAALDPQIAALVAAQDMTAWMVGAQFYLSRDVPVCQGHVAYPDAPWALSSVSQAQFWSRAGAPSFDARFGDGSVRGILSVDISEWQSPGRYTQKTAAACTSAEEVLAEVWAQLKDGLNGGDGPLLDDEDRVDWRLDANVTFGPDGARNPTPLLVHPPGSWNVRPTASTAIGNLMLASDYVRTNTDLATMEGANEAARRAANAIFEREGIATRAAVFPVVEDAGPLVALAKANDARNMHYEAARPFFSVAPGEVPSLARARQRQQQMIEKLRAQAAKSGG